MELLIPTAMLALPLSDFWKSEEQCADEIRRQLNEWVEAGGKPPHGNDLSSRQWLELAQVAATSALQITIIESDEDRDACDYMLDGVRLIHK